jgi:hypothetical protein
MQHPRIARNLNIVRLPRRNTTRIAQLPHRIRQVVHRVGVAVGMSRVTDKRKGFDGHEKARDVAGLFVDAKHSERREPDISHVFLNIILAKTEACVDAIAERFVIPANAHCCPGKFSAVLAGKLKQRHSSESWNPATCESAKALDSSFRWNDELGTLNYQENGAYSLKCPHAIARSNFCRKFKATDSSPRRKPGSSDFRDLQVAGSRLSPGRRGITASVGDIFPDSNGRRPESILNASRRASVSDTSERYVAFEWIPAFAGMTLRIFFANRPKHNPLILLVSKRAKTRGYLSHNPPLLPKGGSTS